MAREIAGVGFSIRREILYTLADIRTVHNRYLLKVANVFDRILRAKQTQAQAHIIDYLRKKQPQSQVWNSAIYCSQIYGREKAIKGRNEYQALLDRGSCWLMIPNGGSISWWMVKQNPTTPQVKLQTKFKVQTIFDCRRFPRL